MVVSCTTTSFIAENDKSVVASPHKAATFEEEWCSLFHPHSLTPLSPFITIIPTLPTEKPSPSLPLPPSLSTLPDLVITCIADNSDYNTQLALAQTSKRVRENIYAPVIEKRTTKHRVKNVTDLMQKVLAAIAMSVLAVIISFVALITGFFAAALYVGNKYSELGHSLDLIILSVVIVVALLTAASMSFFLFYLSRVHLFIVSHAKLLQITLYPSSADGERLSKPEPSILTPSSSSVPSDATTAASGESNNNEVVVNVEGEKEYLEKLSEVEAKLKALPKWWKLAIAIFV